MRSGLLVGCGLSARWAGLRHPPDRRWSPPPLVLSSSMVSGFRELEWRSLRASTWPLMITHSGGRLLKLQNFKPLSGVRIPNAGFLIKGSVEVNKALELGLVAAFLFERRARLLNRLLAENRPLRGGRHQDEHLGQLFLGNRLFTHTLAK